MGDDPHHAPRHTPGKAIEIMNISLDQVEEGKVVEHFGVSDWLRALIVFEIVAAPAAVTSEAIR